MWPGGRRDRQSRSGSSCSTSPTSSRPTWVARPSRSASSRTAKSNTRASRWSIASTTRSRRSRSCRSASGGGSIVWLEPGTNAPRVGPRSAGARPGPVCYGLGGTEPTLTDVFMLIGYMDPDIFLGGTMTLDRDARPRRLRREDCEAARHDRSKRRRSASTGWRPRRSPISFTKSPSSAASIPRDFVLHAFGGSAGWSPACSAPSST